MSAGMIASTERRMVLGMGTTGCSVARWWQARGWPFLAADTRAAAADSLTVRQAIGPDTELLCGDFDPSVMDGVSELVVSPGIALDHPLVLRARESGARVIGDIDLFAQAANAPVIGITGSNGKSTVTAMLGDMIAACGHRVAVGGNLGTAALDLLDVDVEYYVLELSSFQLERAEKLDLALATVLNLQADHLDRHGSMPIYHQAKHRIFRGAKKIVANRSDPLTIPLLEAAVPVVLWRDSEPDLKEFGIRDIEGVATMCQGFEPLLPVSELPLPGAHNRANSLAAVALAAALGLPMADAIRGLKGFKGLPHRCELITEREGIAWFNDSKATNVGSALAAIQGLGDANNIILIAGGVGKGQDFAPLAPAAAVHCRCVLTLGEAAGDIERALGDGSAWERVNDFSEAVARARSIAKPGDTVLLSPACASFDMFEGFEARGDAFRAEVIGQLAAGGLK